LSTRRRIVMQCGISTSCLYPMETKDSLDTLASTGFQVFEVFFNTFREFQFPYLAEIKKCVDAHGAVIKSVHPFTSAFESALIFTNYYTRFLDGLEFYKQYFDAANVLGANIMVLHGQNYRGIDENEYMEKYLTLYQLGKQYGITVAQELGIEPPVRESGDLEDSETITLITPKNEITLENICILAERHVHMNDNSVSEDCLLPGYGTMDYPRLLGQLKQNGYSGAFIIEVYRKNFVELRELNKSALYFNEILSKYFA